MNKENPVIANKIKLRKKQSIEYKTIDFSLFFLFSSVSSFLYDSFCFLFFGILCLR